MRRHRGPAVGVPVIGLALAVVALVAGCAVDEATTAPACEGGGSGLIVAQSVPDASLVPCFDPLPAGWSVASVDVDQTGTVVRLDSDRAGTDAAVLRFTATCDATGAVPVPSDQEGAERYDTVERLEPGFEGERRYLFEGGCVTLHFDFDDGVLSTESVAVGDALVLVRRDEIARLVRETFVDEEL